MVVPTVVEQCPACESDAKRVVFTPDELAWKRFADLSSRKYQNSIYCWKNVLDLVVLECRDCGHFWHRTQPDAESLLRMYNASVPLNPGGVALTSTPYIRKSLLALYKLVKKLGKVNPQLLDYGSGSGRWSRTAVECGFRVTAYEPSEKRSAELQDGSFRLVNDLEELGDSKFDVINLEQVLEHTQRPYDTLKTILQFTDRRTILRVTVPKVAGSTHGLWDTFPFDGMAPHILSPYEHLHGFTPKSLTVLLQRCGFSRIDDFELLSTHPNYVVRRLMARVFPAVAQTLALVEFRAPPVGLSAVHRDNAGRNKVGDQETRAQG